MPFGASPAGARWSLIDRAPLELAVTPSARDSEQFLITAQGVDAYHQQLVDDAASRAEREASEQAQKAEEERLNATVKPGWLIGRWVDVDAGSDACARPGYYEFARGGTAKLSDGSDARWQMQGQLVTLIGLNESQAFLINDAGNDTMSIRYASKEEENLRRCAPSEMRAAVPPDTPTDTMPSADAPSGDTPMPSMG